MLNTHKLHLSADKTLNWNWTTDVRALVYLTFYFDHTFYYADSFFIQIIFAVFVRQIDYIVMTAKLSINSIYWQSFFWCWCHQNIYKKVKKITVFTFTRNVKLDSFWSHERTFQNLQLQNFKNIFGIFSLWRKWESVAVSLHRIRYISSAFAIF